MGKILGIAIENYGSLKDIKMGQLFSDKNSKPLGNMVAIIGASGNGKSTLADAFGFLADCLATDVENACDANNRGGFDQLISQGSNDPIHFAIYYRENSNTSPIAYELTVGKDADDRPCVLQERICGTAQSGKEPIYFLYLQNGKGYAFEETDGTAAGEQKEIELADTRRLGIVTLGAMKQYSRIEKFLTFLRSWYLCYFNPDTARHTQTFAPTPYLNRDGSNLNNVAQFMYRENKADFRKVLSDIQTKIPNIERIEPVKLQNGQMVLEFYQKGFDKPFYANRMSDGTLKLFAYYLLLHEKTPRQLVFVEEPENGLYLQYLHSLASEMKRNVGTGYTKQLFITTHSPFFVNALAPEDVWVLEKNALGFSMARQASTYDFVQELSEEGAPLGDLWYSKYFG